MAGSGIGPEIFLTEERDFDRPDQRRTEFFRLLGTTPQVYAGTVISALDHIKAANQDGQAERWTPLGPRNVGGSMRCIAQDRRNPTTLYAGSAFGGVWKTEDDGYTWTQLGGAELLVPIGALALAPSDSQVLYVGTGEGYFRVAIAGRGLYRSTDGGANFERLAPAGSGGNGASDHYCRIQVDPNEPRRCWVASQTGLWRLEPGGSMVLEPIPLGNGISDVALAPDPANPQQYVLLAGIDGVGIQRGVYTRGGSTAWAAVAGTALPAAPPPATIARVRVAFSTPTVANPQPLGYAVFEDAGYTVGAAVQGFPTVVLQGTNFGQTWNTRAPAVLADVPTANSSGQAFYSMVLEVDPSNALRVLLGYVDLHVSVDGGQTWATLLDWRLYDNGDRAQHADFHALLFDSRSARQLWVCNDGGISFSPDILTLAPSPFAAGIAPPPTPKPVWRKRSFGIACAQFFDITTHPTFPYIVGGGMQDNGTFVSFGGQTWYRLMGADGGALGIDANNPRAFFPTWQSANESIVIGPPGPPPPPQNSATLPEVAPPNNVMAPIDTPITFPTNAAGNDFNPQTFVGTIESDPATSNLILLGRSGGCYYTTDGVNVGLLNIAAFAGNTSALAIAKGAAPRAMFIGTTSGQLWLQTAALPAVPPTPAPGTAPGPVGPAWTNVTPPGLGANAVSSIAIHPTNANVVAVGSWAGGAFLTHTALAAAPVWRAIAGTTHNLPPGPTAALAFDPVNPQVLFAGTVSGVYVARDLPAVGGALPAAVNPTWESYSLGLPFILVNDLEVSTVTNTIRAGTFGRGVYEANIRGATPAQFQIPDVLLSIREHPIDDARTYVAANLFHTDPRLPAPGGPDPADFDHTHAIDIRVDGPSFTRSEAFRFGEAIDGAEFDETLVSDPPLVGDTNFVYVQVQNRGSQPANNVRVFLYFADSGAAPGAAPPITGDINFPNDPAPGSAWQPAAPSQEIGFLHPGQPAVLKFEWIPPISILNTVALLAVCSNGQDNLAAIPAGDPVAFVRGERRAALRITPVNRDMVFIRDGVDDDGNRGGVAWGGRSPDIIVRQGAPVAAPDDPVAGDFRDLGDPRLADRARPGPNLVYVRVHNRTAVAVNASVRLFQLQPTNATAVAGWTLVGGAPVAVNAIPARGWKFTAPIAFTPAADPDPGAPDGQKAIALLAMADTTDGAGTELDPFPDQTGITDFDSFWRFFLTAPLANNAALRTLRFTTAAP